MSTGLPIPVQDRPENQDPDFAYVIDEMTGKRSPLPGGPLDGREKGSKVEADDKDEPARPKRGRAKKQVAKEVGSVVDEETVEKASAAAEAEAEEKPEEKSKED